MKVLLFTLLIFLAGITWSQEKKIAITIDDFPLISTDNSNENQKYVINQLIKHGKDFNAPLIGFVNESKLFKDPSMTKIRESMLKKWLQSGFDLGNHGYSHLNYDRTDTSAYFSDILKGEKVSKVLSEQAGRDFKYFRHPFLHAGNTKEKEIALENFLKRNGYLEAPVTIDNSEWIFARAYDLAIDRQDQAMRDTLATTYIQYMIRKLTYFERNANDLFDRDISHVLLLHANRINADLLGALLAAIQAKGYGFSSLDQVLKDPAYLSDDHIAKPWGISWLHRWARNKKVAKSFYQGEPKCPQFVQDYAGLSE